MIMNELFCLLTPHVTEVKSLVTCLQTFTALLSFVFLFSITCFINSYLFVRLDFFLMLSVFFDFILSFPLSSHSIEFGSTLCAHDRKLDFVCKHFIQSCL